MRFRRSETPTLAEFLTAKNGSLFLTASYFACARTGARNGVHAGGGGGERGRRKAEGERLNDE